MVKELNNNLSVQDITALLIVKRWKAAFLRGKLKFSQYQLKDSTLRAFISVILSEMIREKVTEIESKDIKYVEEYALKLILEDVSDVYREYLEKRAIKIIREKYQDRLFCNMEELTAEELLAESKVREEDVV